VVPPTFGYSLIIAANTSALGFDRLRGDIRFLLHGEQGFRYHELLYVEDDVTITSEVTDMYEKKDGLMRFMVQRTVLMNQHGTLCVESDSTFVIRSPELMA
jgi:acyl dehydratase